MANTLDITPELIRQEWETIAAWPAKRAAREAKRFQREQPFLGTYVFAMLEDQGFAALEVGFELAHTLDAVYRRALSASPAQIGERDMELVAQEVTARFSDLAAAEADLAVRGMLFERTLAMPAVLTELLQLIMDASTGDPETEAAMGALFITAVGIAKAYERAHGLAAADVPKSSLADSIEARTGRPLPKIGRNEPCPCGSGNKFKKCCGQWAAPLAPPQRSHAEELFGQYLGLVDQVWTDMHERERDPDVRWLTRALDDFERRFRPGEPDGVPDSLLLTYGLFDVVVPRRRRTMGELYLERRGARLSEDERQRLRDLCDSYVSCYELIELRGVERQKRLRELISGTEWLVSDIEDLTAEVGTPGEIWLCRLVGPRRDAVTFMSPLIYPAAAREEIESLAHDLLAGESAEALPAAMKRGVELLAEYIIATMPEETDDDDEEETRGDDG